MAPTPLLDNVIGGEWVAAAGEERIESASPATSETLVSIPCSHPADVDRAVAAAKAAFFYRPTVLGDVEPGMRIAREQVFVDDSGRLQRAQIDTDS